MTDERFYLEVSHGEIIVTAPGTSHRVSYHRVSREGGLIVKSSSGMTNEEAPMTHAEFLARAWKRVDEERIDWCVANPPPHSAQPIEMLFGGY